MSAIRRNTKVRTNRYRKKTASRRNKNYGGVLAFVKFCGSIIVVAVMSTAFIFSYDILTQCDYFRAKAIEVEGTKLLSMEEVIETSGVNVGDNIFLVNLMHVRKRLLSHPWISEAEVIRELPDGFSFVVREHQPLAVIDLERKFLINKKGEIFKEVKDNEGESLPIVKGLNYSDLKVSGSTESRIYGAVMDVLKFTAEPGSAIYGKGLGTIKVDREMGLSICSFSNIGEINLGFDNYFSKLNRLKNVLFFVKRNSEYERVDSIDLNNLDKIVVRPVFTGQMASEGKEV